MSKAHAPNWKEASKNNIILKFLLLTFSLAISKGRQWQGNNQP
jgi:hypothetical protein